MSKICEAILGFGDGYENTYTFCCMLEAGHGGPHYDEFEHDGQTVVIVWYPEKFAVSVASKEE